MNNFKPGMLSADGVVFDFALPMHGDGEYRVPRVEEEPDMDLEPDDDGPQTH